MAKLTFKYAAMNSGKTLDLIRTAYNYEENGCKTLVIKPRIDTKGENKITSRIGVYRDVDYLIDENDSILEVLYNKLEKTKCIFADESQFFTKEQIDDLFVISKVFNVDVICYGLRLNFKMQAFEGSKRLLEISDILEELKTMCSCGNIARYVGRKVNGNFTIDGDEVVIDGTNDVEYISLCGDCYLEKVKKLDYNLIKKRGVINGR